MPEWLRLILTFAPIVGVALAVLTAIGLGRRRRPRSVVVALTAAVKADADAAQAQVARTAQVERDVAQVRRDAEARAATGKVSMADAQRALKEAREWPESD
jgi:hypothetical protein